MEQGWIAAYAVLVILVVSLVLAVETERRRRGL